VSTEARQRRTAFLLGDAVEDSAGGVTPERGELGVAELDEDFSLRTLANDVDPC